MSHTSELSTFPAERSFVQVALDGVSRAGRAYVDMRYFAAREGQPADYCRERVRGCGVYVGVIGFRYGSMVPGLDVSYTELEFLTAGEAGIPRLVFLLDERTPLPLSMVDHDRTAAEGFRQRLQDAGVIVGRFSSPSELDLGVYQALTELLDRQPAPVAVDGHGAMGRIPLAAARQDPGAVFTAVGVTRFSGREWVTEQLDQFMENHSCGYVWVEAEAGLGKTALAAHLVYTREYLSHFVRRGESSTTTRVALRNLAAQVIEGCDLNEWAPGGMLPDWVQEPEGFARLLALAVAHGLPGGRLVLVVDGLDEAERPLGGLPLGLPDLLPEGVFIIGTYRTGNPPAAVGSASAVVRIEASDARNLADIDTFLAIAVGEEALAARLAEQDVRADDFVRQLTDHCHGVWVYLRYVLAEVRLAATAPTTSQTCRTTCGTTTSPRSRPGSPRTTGQPWGWRCWRRWAPRASR